MDVSRCSLADTLSMVETAAMLLLEAFHILILRHVGGIERVYWECFGKGVEVGWRAKCFELEVGSKSRRRRSERGRFAAFLPRASLCARR